MCNATGGNLQGTFLKIYEKLGYLELRICNMGRKSSEFTRLLVAQLWENYTADRISGSMYYALENYMSGIVAGKFAAARSRWTEEVLIPAIKEIKDMSLKMVASSDQVKNEESFEAYAMLVEVTAEQFKAIEFENFKDPEVAVVA